MKLDVPSNVLASHGLQKTQQFQIKAGAHAFKLLSSGLYSDKIGAVLREIGCNAVDAHIAAGCPDKPFEVHMPTRLTNKFYIRDFGPGLSEADVHDLYTTYFSSSKSQSNEFTGAFGLGSKSPFAYTDRFTIVSYFAGEKTIYAAFIGEDGSPTVSKVSAEPMLVGESTGMMISMPIRPGDYHELDQKAKIIYSWFRVPPTMLNSTPIERRKYAVEHSEWALQDRTYSNAEPKVLMGNVAYPLMRNLLVDSVAYEWAVNTSLVLKLNIGDIDIAASREHIEMTPRTTKFLTDRLNKVCKEGTQSIIDTVSALDFSTKDNILAAKQVLAPIGSAWRIASNVHSVPRELRYNVERTMYDRSWKVHEDLQAIECTYRRIERNRNNDIVVRTDREFKFGSFSSFYVDKDMRVLDRAVPKYMRERLTTLPRGTILIQPNDEAVDVNDFAAKLYGIPVLDASTLSLPADFVPPSKRPRQPRKKKVHTARVMVEDGNEKEEPIFDSTAEHFYVFRYNAWGVNKYFDRRHRNLDIQSVVTCSKKLQPHIAQLPSNVVLLTETEYAKHKLGDKTNWRPVTDLIDELLHPKVRDLVNTADTNVVRDMWQQDQSVPYANSALDLLASHAKKNTQFWRTLHTSIPKSKLIQAAAAAGASGKLVAVDPTRPVAAQDYNLLLSALGEYKAQIPQSSMHNYWITKYPVTESIAHPLRQGFKNQGVAAMVRMFIAAILIDEEGVLPEFDYQKLAA